MTYKLYLLYHDEDITNFHHPDIIPVKLNQTVYFESEFFRMLDISKIPDADTIGIITPTIEKKTKKSLSEFLSICELPIPHIQSFVHHEIRENDMLDLAVASHGEEFFTVWNYLLHSLHLKYEHGCQGFYSNTWIAPRNIFIEYVTIAKNAIQILDNSPKFIKDKLYSNSKYKIPTLKMMEVFKLSYYPLHPFIMERLICIFAHLKNKQLT